MPVTALVGYSVFLALAFGLRAALHYRQTGTTGFIGLTGSAWSTEWWAGVLFAVATIGGVLGPVAQLAGLVEPWVDRATAAGEQLGTMAVEYQLGIVLTILGIAGTLWAQLAMGRSWRVGVDQDARTDLVSRGPFRFVRNPIFTWMTFASAGLMLLAPNVLAVGSFLTLLVALELQVRRVEEPYLLRTHGDAYRRYASATGRFLPGIGRLG
ncbi:MAG: isoprenylcysteine carboxylmethyltransferase family protein [Candidatus Binatia bacterium]